MLPSRKRTQGGASLCPGLSPFAPLVRTDREHARGQRPEARGERREGTAKQPENFGAILSRYPRITMHVASPRKSSVITPGPVVTTTGRGCVSPPGLMNANLCGSICLYCISGHMWPLQPSSLTRGRPPQPPRPLLPRPTPRWRRGAKRLDGADVRCEV